MSNGFKLEDAIDYAEIPSGWESLVAQMCMDLSKVVDRKEFRFIQIKEKFGMLRCYYHPTSSEVYKIIHKYEHLSQYICCMCGKPATMETLDYICPYCDKCHKAYEAAEKVKSVVPDLIIFYEEYNPDSGDSYMVDLNCTDEWNRYCEKFDF